MAGGQSGAPKGNRNASGNRGGDGVESPYIEGTWDRGPRSSHPYRAYQLTLLLGKYSAQSLARSLGVSRQTIYNWRREHPNFDEAIYLGGVEADARVARSLHRAALGGRQKKVKVVYDREFGIFKEHEYIDFVEANVNAQLSWLAARHPEQWGPRQRIQFSDKDEARKTVAKILGIEPEDLPE